MAAALLFVALLVVVDLSYRRWMRRSIARHRKRALRAPVVVDLHEADTPETETGAAAAAATVIALPPRDITARKERRSG